MYINLKFDTIVLSVNFYKQGSESMDFRQLETFIEVVKLRSFSKAAEKLFITQPTVTNHIQNLEKELGTLLINRLGKRITLTEAGSLLYKYAINIVNSCEMAKFDLAVYQGRIQGHLNIMFSSVPRNYLLPSLIKSFLETYPEVSFTISDNDSEEVISKIVEGEVDFGIVGAKFSNQNLYFKEVIEDNLVLITPSSFKEATPNFSFISIDEILNHKIIFREEGSGTRSLVMDKLKEKEIDISNLHILAYVEDTETIKEMVSLGLGLSFLSEKSIKKDIKLNNYKVFYIKEIEFKRKFYFVYHKNRQLSPLSETFKEHILNYTESQSL